MLSAEGHHHTVWSFVVEGTRSPHVPCALVYVKLVGVLRSRPLVASLKNKFLNILAALATLLN